METVDQSLKACFGALVRSAERVVGDTLRSGVWAELKKAAHSCCNGVVKSPVIQRERRCATMDKDTTVTF